MKRLFLFVMFVLCGSIQFFAQYKNNSFLQYIEQYQNVAMDHQKRFKIPSSIILAQGLMESGAGNSKLTKESNNHFGIKCHNGWDGPRVYHDDDKKDDCFRKYNLAKDSYEDHSQFLTVNQRYSFLFNLDPRDYRGWATGLQQAGYATDKSYANKLIKIIEDYELYRFDAMANGRREVAIVEKKSNKPVKIREIFISQELYYVIAKKGDTYDAISTELDIKLKDLIKYNEVPEDFPLKAGDIVYLQKKHKKTLGGYRYHIVKPGESMHTISQMYGIRMEYLYKKNHLDMEYIPNDGDTLKLQ